MLLVNSRGNGFSASAKQTICKYVQAARRSRSRAADKNVVWQSTTTRLEFVSKKFRLTPQPAVSRKKIHKLIQRKYKQVICFKRRHMAKRCQSIVKNNEKPTTTTCCERRQKHSLIISTNLRSNNGSYFSKTKKRKSQQQKQHHSFQQWHYYNNNNGSIKNRMQQQQQQQQQQHIDMIKRNFQILRLYARSGVHLRRRRKRRFFINLYTNTLQFRKLKAIKRSTALMHNNTMPLKAKISLSSLENVTVKSASFHNKRNQLERTKCTIQQQQHQEEKYEKDEEEEEKNQQQKEYKFEKSNGNQIYSLSTTAHSNSKNGNGSWRLLLTSLIALTASRGTGLSTELSGTLRKTLTTLFQRLQLQVQLQQLLLLSCQLNALNKKYSWIFLLIYLHLNAKGKINYFVENFYNISLTA